MKTRRRKYDYIKRGLDIFGAGIGIVVLSPVIGLTALVVRIKLGSPVIFKQERPGLNGENFTLYKFRSMVSIDETRGIIVDEDRITPFGRKLRATSLDELPSLINVLKGDMSIVGPRPLLKHYLPLYTEEQARRHNVKPGITGLAQVNGRNDLEWERKFELDVEYVARRSFKLDVAIIWRTVIAVFHRRGVNKAGYELTDYFGGLPHVS